MYFSQFVSRLVNLSSPAKNAVDPNPMRKAQYTSSRCPSRCMIFPSLRVGCGHGKQCLPDGKPGIQSSHPTKVCFSVRLWNEEICAGTAHWQVLFTLGIFVRLFPISMLLVVGGALCAGGLAAAWFTRARRTIRHVHRIQVVIEPDAKPELLEKIN